MPLPRVIFVVDDEPILGRTVVRILRDPAYAMHVFDDPLVALASIDESRPDLVISDHEMPQMTGLDLLRKIRARRPEVRTVMLSGGPLGDQVRAAVARGEIDRLVQKPCLNETLRAVVRELLGSS